MSIHDDAKAQADLEARARQAGREPFAQRMIDATDAGLFADLRKDAQCNPVRASSSLLPEAPGARHQVGNGRGWVDPAPLANGYNRHIEAQLDAQDARDRAERERQFGKRGG